MSAARPVIGWSLATACAVIIAIALGLAPRLHSPDPTAPTPLAGATTEASGSAYDEAFAALDEDPDFYLWLGTTDVQPLALE